MRAVKLAFLCLIGLFSISVSQAQEPAKPAEQLFVDLELSLAAGALALAPELEDMRSAAASGDPASQLLLGRYLMEGRRTARQTGQGLELLELAASAGLAEANYRVGEAYRNGVLGMRRQPARALGFYEAAAKAGDKPAARAMAGLLLDQRYAFADRARGLELLEGLASEGDVQALLSLGGAYSAVDGSAAIFQHGRVRPPPLFGRKAVFVLAVFQPEGDGLRRLGYAAVDAVDAAELPQIGACFGLGPLVIVEFIARLVVRQTVAEAAIQHVRL